MSLNGNLTRCHPSRILLPQPLWLKRADLPGTNRPEARGKAIAEITDATNLGFGDTTSEMEMILTNANGDESERRLRFNTLENKDVTDGDWSMMIFDEPADISNRHANLCAYSRPG